ncbi:radical SAM protein [bacterium]|nr:radical SAM protein [bacterium]
MSKKTILRKEYFGGICADTERRTIDFLKPHEYESKKNELLDREKNGNRVLFFDGTQLGYPLLADAASSPIDLFLELTKRCDNQCSHCFVDSRPLHDKSAELSLNEITTVVDQFSAAGGFYLRLTGGEPTIREDFFDIVDMANEKGLVIGLNTNGLFKTKVLEGILARKIKDIRISLDGPPAINDRIRGKGRFDKAYQTLKVIHGYNICSSQPVTTTINMVLMKSNIDTIEEMVDLSLVLGSKISFGLLRLSGKADPSEMLTPDDVMQASFRVDQARRNLNLDQKTVRINYDVFSDFINSDSFTPFPFDNSKCPIGVRGFLVDTNGRVVPCGYLVSIDNGRWSGEDVTKGPLLDIWHNSKILKESRKVVRSGCQGCKYHIEKCNGGCPVMAYVFNQDIDGMDPYCVKHVNIENLQ